MSNILQEGEQLGGRLVVTRKLRSATATRFSSPAATDNGSTFSCYSRKRQADSPGAEAHRKELIQTPPIRRAPNRGYDARDAAIQGELPPIKLLRYPSELERALDDSPVRGLLAFDSISNFHQRRPRSSSHLGPTTPQYSRPVFSSSPPSSYSGEICQCCCDDQQTTGMSSTATEGPIFPVFCRDNSPDPLGTPAKQPAYNSPKQQQTKTNAGDPLSPPTPAALEKRQPDTTTAEPATVWFATTAAAALRAQESSPVESERSSPARGAPRQQLIHMVPAAAGHPSTHHLDSNAGNSPLRLQERVRRLQLLLRRCDERASAFLEVFLRLDPEQRAGTVLLLEKRAARLLAEEHAEMEIAKALQILRDA